MCNAFNVTTNQQAIREVTSAMEDEMGNLEASLDLFPSYQAPIVRNIDGKRQMTRVRWGLPSSSKALFDAASERANKLRVKGKEVDFEELLKKEPDGGTTNDRITTSKHWTRWLGVENRCVFPFTRFAEPDYTVDKVGGRTPNAWFAASEDCPLRFFAGIWVPQWTYVNKVKTGFETVDLCGFLTTEPNGVVGPIHKKAMPVILRNKEEVHLWLTQPWAEAKFLQRPLPDGDLMLLPRAA
jgi:putative SOS response-associated peptidase YedK